MDINQLIEQLRNGEASAGPILVSIIAPHLLGYAASIAQDLSDADRETAVELATEKAIDTIDRYDPTKGTFIGWLRGFVRYRIADARRDRPGEHSQLPDDWPAADSTESDDDVTSPTSAALAALVLTLSEADQLLVQLRFVELLPHSVIAERLKTTEAACRKRQQRVLERLRKNAATDADLAKFYEGDES